MGKKLKESERKYNLKSFHFSNLKTSSHLLHVEPTIRNVDVGNQLADKELMTGSSIDNIFFLKHFTRIMHSCLALF